MATVIKRIEPVMSFKGPGGWRRADPVTGYYPQEEPTDNVRNFLWPTKGLNISISTSAPGNKPTEILACPGDISNDQTRKEAVGWQPMYVDEILP